MWRNVGTGSAEAPTAMGHWIAVRAEQPAPNTNAIGGWVEVRVGDRLVTEELTSGGGHASGSAGWLHVGIGNATTAEVRVTFPGAEPGPWQTVQADAFWTIERDAAAPRRWQPS